MRTPSFIIFILVMLLLASFIGVLAYWTFNPPTASRDQVAEKSNLTTNAPPSRPVISSPDPIRGDPNAPLAIVEFGDFFCPACAEVKNVLDSVLEQYKGRVKLVWKDFPNTRAHPLAQKAAQAARCASAQGKFWEYHDQLFGALNQGQPLSEQGLSLIAQNLNLNTNKFEECLTSGAMIDTVTRTFNEGLLLQVDGTPYFFIGEKRVSGAASEEEFKKVLENLL